MSLEAKIARIQLNSLPSSIADRLLKHRDFVELIDVGSASVPNIGQFKFADVRSALSSAPIGTFVEVPGMGGMGIAVARAADALFRVRDGSGKEVYLPELSLLDPSVDIRMEGIKCLSNRTLPNWPRASIWKDAVLNSPLSDRDFGLVLDELQQVGVAVINRIGQRLESANFSVIDIIPTSAIYYESILGKIPESMAASQYIADMLSPHLASIGQKSPFWALRYVQAVCISDVVDPGIIMAHVSNDDLMGAIQSSGIGRTPSALLATYKLALSRVSTDERFAAISQSSLNCLIERTCAIGETSDYDELLIALVCLTMSVIGQANELALAPTFWRRLAAFAHATILLETFQVSDDYAKELTELLANCLTPESDAVQILDCLAEPRWCTDALHPRKLWASALLGAIQSTPENRRSEVLSPTQRERAEPYFFLVRGVPDPLNGARLGQTGLTLESLSEDCLGGIQTENSAGETCVEPQIWPILAHYAKVYRFEDGLLLKVRELTRIFTPRAQDKFSEACVIFELCCRVASRQGDIELAEIVASRILELCGELTAPADVHRATLIVLLAAGADKDQIASFEWAADRLLALAYRLPRGISCAALAEIITVFQRLIPLKNRRWGKALVNAQSAAG